MTRTVICGVDHAPEAHSVVEAAAALAEGIDAMLILAHARSSGVPAVAAAPHAGFAGWAPMDPACEEDSFELLDRLVVHAGSVAAETLVLDGAPAESLCDLARQCGSELVVVGSRGIGAVGRLLLGSVSAEVTRCAPCPVVVIPHGALVDVERPVVDGSMIVCAIGTPLDRRLAVLGGALASGLGLHLRLVHVLAPLADMADARVCDLERDDAVAPPGSREVAVFLRDTLDEIIDAYPDLDGRSSVCVRSGDAVTELADLAARSHAAAIVVGARGRGTLRRAVRRSRASALARTATVPVVICHTDAH